MNHYAKTDRADQNTTKKLPEYEKCCSYMCLGAIVPFEYLFLQTAAFLSRESINSMIVSYTPMLSYISQYDVKSDNFMMSIINSLCWQFTSQSLTDQEIIILWTDKTKTTVNRRTSTYRLRYLYFAHKNWIFYNRISRFANTTFHQKGSHTSLNLYDVHVV